MYPIVPMSMRNVMNSCVVEGYELPVGARVAITQTAAHYMDDVFPDPASFDIDRFCLHVMRTSVPAMRRTVWMRTRVSVTMDDVATGGQRGDDRALLHERGIPCELHTPVQPAPVDEAEQEAEVPHRRAEA